MKTYMILVIDLDIMHSKTYQKKAYRLHNGDIQVKHNKQWMAVKERAYQMPTLFLDVA